MIASLTIEYLMAERDVKNSFSFVKILMQKEKTLVYPCNYWLIAIFVCLFIFISGCYCNEPLPVISDVPSPEVIVSKPVVSVPRVDQRLTGIPKDWWPSPYLEKSWSSIVIHHSATDNGNVAIFDKMHREDKHWNGIGYDFVIGNGTDSGNGSVEVTYRWREQKIGAHCKTPGNWANRDAVGICLVGDFNGTRPTAAQMRSLVKLVRFLQKRYGITQSRIYGHGTTPGAHATDCPGKYFPMAKLKSVLDY